MMTSEEKCVMWTCIAGGVLLVFCGGLLIATIKNNKEIKSLKEQIEQQNGAALVAASNVACTGNFAAGLKNMTTGHLKPINPQPQQPQLTQAQIAAILAAQQPAATPVNSEIEMLKILQQMTPEQIEAFKAFQAAQ